MNAKCVEVHNILKYGTPLKQKTKITPNPFPEFSLFSNLYCTIIFVIEKMNKDHETLKKK